MHAPQQRYCTIRFKRSARVANGTSQLKMAVALLLIVPTDDGSSSRPRNSSLGLTKIHMLAGFDLRYVAYRY